MKSIYPFFKVLHTIHIKATRAKKERKKIAVYPWFCLDGRLHTQTQLHAHPHKLLYHCETNSNSIARTSTCLPSSPPPPAFLCPTLVFPASPPPLSPVCLHFPFICFLYVFSAIPFTTSLAIPFASPPFPIAFSALHRFPIVTSPSLSH